MAEMKAAKKAARKGARPAAKKSAKKPERKAAKNAADRGAVDWRAGALDRARALIHEADPAIVEEIKWRKPSNPGGVPVWSRDGIVCTGETYKDSVKMTFAKGALLKDPARLFNASLEGFTRRAIDLRRGDALDAQAFQALVREAVDLNVRTAKRQKA